MKRLKNIVYTTLLVFVFLMLIQIRDAAANDNDCRYQKKKFITEQLIKNKVSVKISSIRSTTLVGVDALFL